MTTPSEKSYSEKDRRHQYYLLNKESIKQKSHERYMANREKAKQQNIEYRKKHKDRLHNLQREDRKNNPEKYLKRNQRWRSAHREQCAKMTRTNWLRRRYGISPDEWEMIFQAQGNRCAICKSDTPGKQSWHLDHDHSTGRVRGILCHMCNILLGSAVDNCDNLMSAIKYLIANNPNS